MKRSLSNTIQVVLYYIFSFSKDHIVLKFKNGFQLFVPKWYNFQSIAETIFLDVYHSSAQNHDTGCIVDVGASIGDFVVNIRRRGHGNKICAFEPEKSSFAILKLNIELNRLENVVALNEPASHEAILRLLAAEKYIAFLKIDCEGCEYEILNGQQNSWLRNVKEIHMETHRDFPNVDMQLSKLMASSGFIVTSLKVHGCPYLHATLS